MTANTENIKKFELGRDYWIQYEKLNGWAIEPSDEGLEKLSQNLDINKKWLREHIAFYLES